MASPWGGGQRPGQTSMPLLLRSSLCWAACAGTGWHVGVARQLRGSLVSAICLRSPDMAKAWEPVGPRAVHVCPPSPPPSACPFALPGCCLVPAHLLGPAHLLRKNLIASWGGEKRQRIGWGEGVLGSELRDRGPLHGPERKSTLSMACSAPSPHEAEVSVCLFILSVCAP